MVEIVGHTTAGGWEDSTSIAVPEGVQEGDLLRVWISANDAPELEAPQGWTLEVSDVGEDLGGNTAVYSFVRTASQADENGPTYTWNWPGGEHWRFAVMVALTGAESVRTYELSANPNTSELDSAELTAEPGDLLLIFGYNRHDTEKTWSPAGLTEIANLDRGVVAAYQVPGEGPVQVYTLQAGESGTMAVLTVLIESVPDEIPDGPNIVWSNTFDGPNNTQVTVTNTGYYGDPISNIVGDGVAGYLTQRAAVGTTSILVGATTEEVHLSTSLEEDAYDWGIRAYLWIPGESARGIISVNTGGASTNLVETATTSPTSPLFRVLGQSVPSEVVEELFDKWIRFEANCSESRGDITFRLWWNDYQSTGEPGYEGTRVRSEAPPRFNLRSFVLGGSLAGTNGIWFDEVAVAANDEWIGPAQERTVEPTWQNSFDGPDGIIVTVSNSGNHGDPLEDVGFDVLYSEDWYIPNASGGIASLHVGGPFELPPPDSDTWSLRWYANVGDQLDVGGSTDLVNIEADEQFSVLGQDQEDHLDEVSHQTIRCEVMCRAGALTARIWWTDPQDYNNPDLVVVDDEADFPESGTITFEGSVEDGDTYVDEIAMSDEAGVIGPVTHTGAEASVTFTATASGVVGGSANAVADIDITVDTQGYRSDLGAGIENVQFSTEASGEGFIPTVAVASIEYTTEASGGPYYTGGAEYGLDIDTETDGTKTTSGDALEGEVVYEPTAAGRARTHLPDVPLVGMQYRLIAYEPDGQRRGQLPWPLSFQLGVPLNDIPSLALEYLKDAPGADLLNSLCEVAVEFARPDSPSFTEPPGCRFLNLRHQEDPADRTGVVRYTMPSYAWMLRKVRNLNTDALNEEGQREFSQATPGQIIHTFLFEAQERDNVPGMVWDFTATHDSNGDPWESAYNISFDAGQDLWTILEALATQNALDWRVHRRTLQMYNPDTAMNRDRSEQAVLRLHRDVSEAPNDRSGEEMASRIFVQGDNAHVQITNNASTAPWGAWEDYIAQNGVSDTGTLTALAQWRLDATTGLRTQMTRGILFNTARHLPFFAYDVGDYISAPGWFSQMDPLRVRQITINSTDPHSLEGNLVLNDRFIERQLRNDRKINALTGGSPPGGGGGGGRPPGEDTRTPQAPESLLLASDAYINEYGEPRAQITADWDEVTHATNNTEMDIRRYEVWVRHATFGNPFQFQTEVDHPQTTAHMSWFEPGEVYEVRVRAFGRNDRPGLWSETVPVMAERDTDPPEEPSEPQISSRLGVLRVAWDGLDFMGSNMPSDFDHLQVWMGESTNDEFERVDTLYRAGVSVIPNQPYGEERFFFFVAVDRASNESEPSAIASGTTERLVPIDVTPGSIGYELLEEGAVRDEVLADDAVMNRHVAAGQITGEKIRAYSIFADRIAVGSSRNLLTDPKFLNEDLNEVRNELSTGEWVVSEDNGGNVVSITMDDDDNPQGSYEFRLVQSLDVDSMADRSAGYSVSAEMGRIIFRTHLDVDLPSQGTVLVTAQARFINRDDVVFDVSTSVTQQSFTDSVEDYEFISNTGAVIPSGAVSVVLCVNVNLSSAPEGTNVAIRDPFSAMSDGQVLIENGAISANKIQANAITADKIEAGAVEAQHIRADAIDADKIEARAITAKHTIVGATIRTTEEAFRGVVMNQNGLMAYDSVGQQTFTIAASTGSVNMLGRLRTGRAGQNRVEVSDSANYLNQPGVRLYSGGAGARDSSLFIADGQGTGGWDPYTVALTGAETTRNSTGRTDLALRPYGSGGASLRYQWSSWGVVGISFSDYQMHIYGRNSTGQHSNAYMVWGRTETLSNSGSEFSGTAYQVINYGAAPPVSSRMVQVSGHANQQFAKVASTVSEQMPTHVRLSGSRYNGGSFRLQYFAMWVQASVAN